jgi:hypothetical protein
MLFVRGRDFEFVETVSLALVEDALSSLEQFRRRLGPVLIQTCFPSGHECRQHVYVGLLGLTGEVLLHGDEGFRPRYRTDAVHGIPDHGGGLAADGSLGQRLAEMF